MVGPGAYNIETKHNKHQGKFLGSKRFDNNEKSNIENPGPGNYNIDS